MTVVAVFDRVKSFYTFFKHWEIFHGTEADEIFCFRESSGCCL